MDLQKLAGLLIELQGDPKSGSELIVGIGINVWQPDWPLKMDFDLPWIDFHRMGVSVDRSHLLGMLISDLYEVLIDFEVNGFAPHVEQWNKLNCFADTNVIVSEGEHRIVGCCRGVDEAGALLIEGNDGQIHRFLHSNVSVRPVHTEPRKIE